MLTLKVSEVTHIHMYIHTYMYALAGLVELIPAVSWCRRRRTRHARVPNKRCVRKSHPVGDIKEGILVVSIIVCLDLSCICNVCAKNTKKFRTKSENWSEDNFGSFGYEYTHYSTYVILKHHIISLAVDHS